MRIAVSGTHCTGKTTLIDYFLTAHPDFATEPEPYIALLDQGEVFAAEPSADDFLRQLEFSIDRLHSHFAGKNVIYDRCPVDFLAYILALADLGRDLSAADLVKSTLNLAQDALTLLDLIVLLPLDDVRHGVLPDSEDPELQRAVDSQLTRILSDDDFNLFGSRSPLVIEARGLTQHRLVLIEAAIEKLRSAE